MWYENSYRRHLLDMHIDDWDSQQFLSQYSAEDYYNNLKAANVKSAIIYMQSHVGYCYYPTKTGHAHSFFAANPDEIKKLVNLCKDGGIDPIAYYSINYNRLECDYHPDWVVKPKSQNSKTMHSGSRFVVCCPNNPDYLQFVLDQITEIFEYADFEGILFDMPFWKNTCYCEHCSKKYLERTGKELPEDKESPEWLEFRKVREEWTDEYIGAISRHVRKCKPNATVQFNYAYTVLNAVEFIGSEVINKHQDYASGDLYGDFITQSFVCKFYSSVTQNMPFEYMASRCDPGLNCHTVTKSDDKLRLGAMLTTAHHGANYWIDAIDPSGAMDSRFYKNFRKIYDEVEFYEPYLKTGEMVNDIGLFYIVEGRQHLDPDTQKHSHYSATLNTSKILIKNHIPYGMVTCASAKKGLSKYKAIIISNPNSMDSETIKTISEYVKNGGILYFSGGDQPELLKELLGGEVQGFTNTQHTYLASKPEYRELFNDFNTEYPLPLQVTVPRVKFPEEVTVLGDVVLPYIDPENPNAFSSIHSNPPGTLTTDPAAAYKKVGKGAVVWMAGNIERESVLVYQKVLFNLLKFAGVNEFSISTTANRNTEIITFKADDKIQVNAVYLTDEEETSVQIPFEISVKCDKQPKAVKLIKDSSLVDFEYSDGFVKFTTKPLNIFDMYEIEF